MPTTPDRKADYAAKRRQQYRNGSARTISGVLKIAIGVRNEECKAGRGKSCSTTTILLGYYSETPTEEPTLEMCTLDANDSELEKLIVGSFALNNKL